MFSCAVPLPIPLFALPPQVLPNLVPYQPLSLYHSLLFLLPVSLLLKAINAASSTMF